MRSKFSLPALVALVGLIALPTQAQQVPVGARALGMGGAYTAVADDIYATYWNPAGIAYVNGSRTSLFDISGRLSLTGNNNLSTLISNFPTDTASRIKFAQQFGTGISAAAVAATIGDAAHGFAFTFRPFASATLVPFNPANGTNDIIGANGQPVNNSLANFSGVVGYEYVATATHKFGDTFVGVNAKVIDYYTFQSTIQFLSDIGQLLTNNTSGQSVGVAFDLGVLQKVGDRATVGATLRDLFAPGVLPTKLSLGAAVHPFKKQQHLKSLLFSADVENIGDGDHTHINLGAEYVVANFLALRAGVFRGQPTLGLGLGKYLQAAYGPNENLLSVSFGF